MCGVKDQERHKDATNLAPGITWHYYTSEKNATRILLRPASAPHLAPLPPYRSLRISCAPWARRNKRPVWSLVFNHCGVWCRPRQWTRSSSTAVDMISMVFKKVSLPAQKTFNTLGSQPLLFIHHPLLSLAVQTNMSQFDPVC